MEKALKSISCYCHRCKQHTNHDVLFSKTENSGSDEYWWEETYSVVRCCGCDELSFLLESSSEDDFEYDDDGNEYLAAKNYTYPYKEPLVFGLTHLWSVPQSIVNVYEETLKALNDECYMLAAAGFRIIIEATCIENGISGSTLETKINNLCKANIITKRDRDRLHSIRFMGNDSVHNMKTPNKETLIVVLDIINMMLKNLYILDVECRNALEGPITNFEDFIELLDKGLKAHTVGSVDILKHLVATDHRLIKDDIRNFEMMLIDKIEAGEYTKLQLCPPPQKGRRQQYKILSM